MTSAPLTLGTAGHIDHGKTALIRLLTGVDTDRLPEERARGISIELGYAQLELSSGRRLSVIDVPGHERFVRTMVAGATGIDLFLMTVAADDGVMPQTREHAAVLRALGVDTGVVAITKCDLTDPSLATAEVAELFPAAPTVAVSARTGAGLPALLAALDRAAAQAPSRAARSGADATVPRLHIDRAFTIRGAGTVVTGTLWSGEVGRGDELMLLPAGRRARVRGVQVHDQPLTRATAGQRVAINLTNVAVGDVVRGDVVAQKDAPVAPTYRMDATLRWEPDREPPSGERVQVHHGTRETPARLAWLGGRFWQLRLEQPLVPMAGDHLVIRRIAPPDTLGGGVVLDPRPRRHGPSRALLARLERLERGEDPEPQVPRGDAVSAGVKRHADRSRPPSIEVALTPAQTDLEQRLLDAGLEPPLDRELDPGDLAALRDAGRAVRVSKALHYHAEVLADARRRVLALAQRNGGMVTVAQLRDELGTSRKFAQALLEHLDSEKVTIRRGDAHHVRGGRSYEPARGWRGRYAHPVATEKAQRFLSLHHERRPLLLPNVWDAGSAKLVRSLGFKTLATTSSGHAATLGRLDGAVTREEALAHAGTIVAATELPVSADLENGFAHDPDGVAETVALALEAGLAGCSIEDATGDADEPIYELAAARERVAAAVEAAHRGPQKLVLTARAENLIHGRPDLDDTIARLQAYEEAGADVLFAPGLTSADDIARVLESVDLPVNVLALPGAPSVGELGELGVSRVSVGGAFAFAAIGALVEAAVELHKQGTYSFLERSAEGLRAVRETFGA
ncbi:MAG: selenocysteine-specific translation elongation factor [Solirubrobacterales bacterium]|nr:selenocysteine-specific translation elongation factor [Solirubrobacterales bacterium]